MSKKVNIMNLSRLGKMEDTDYFVIDGDEGTKLIKASDILDSLDSPGIKKNLYRGENLGSTYTDSQKKAVKEGTFKGIFIGDYWSKNGYIWRVADIDAFYNGTGRHHIIVVPDKTFGNTAISNGKPMDYFVTDNLNLTKAINSRDSIFGDDSWVPSDNAAKIGFEDGRRTRQSFNKVMLMSETEVFGHLVNGFNNFSTSYNQFAMFRLNPDLITSTNPDWYWLRDGMRSSLEDTDLQLNSSGTAVLYNYGSCVHGTKGIAIALGLEYKQGVRPYSVIF